MPSRRAEQWSCSRFGLLADEPTADVGSERRPPSRRGPRIEPATGEGRRNLGPPSRSPAYACPSCRSMARAYYTASCCWTVGRHPRDLASRHGAEVGMRAVRRPAGLGLELASTNGSSRKTQRSSQGRAVEPARGGVASRRHANWQFAGLARSDARLPVGGNGRGQRIERRRSSSIRTGGDGEE